MYNAKSYHTIQSQFFLLHSFCANFQAEFSYCALLTLVGWDGIIRYAFVQLNCKSGYYGMQSAMILNITG